MNDSEKILEKLDVFCPKRIVRELVRFLSEDQAREFLQFMGWDEEE